MLSYEVWTQNDTIDKVTFIQGLLNRNLFYYSLRPRSFGMGNFSNFFYSGQYR